MSERDSSENRTNGDRTSTHSPFRPCLGGSSGGSSCSIPVDRPADQARAGSGLAGVNVKFVPSHPISTSAPLPTRSFKQRGGQRVGEPLLDDPLQRPGAVGRVEALVGELPLGRRR